MNRVAAGAGLLALTVSLPAADSPADAAITERILEELQQARSTAGVPELSRRAVLDEIARARALEIARLPARRRLSGSEPVGAVLERAGVRPFRRAYEHLDLRRGFADPAAAFAETWQATDGSWAVVLEPQVTAVGLGTALADDGWLVLIGILVEDRKIPTDVPALERAAVRQINKVRRKHDLSPLEPDARLAEVARRHSREMVRRGFFDHEAPDGSGPADRVTRHGLLYRKVAENIQLNNDEQDPVRVAVEAWMASRRHRVNILDPEFTTTGVGVAIHADGTVYFTQLFLRPRALP